MEADRSLTFGDFSLDLAKEQLFCSGEVVALTPKAFVVLRRLVDDGGQLVSKEELLQAGWPKTHVSHGVLKVIILEIRRALDDNPVRPLETLAEIVECLSRTQRQFMEKEFVPVDVGQ